jgi:hypothetical protein
VAFALYAQRLIQMRGVAGTECIDASAPGLNKQQKKTQRNEAGASRSVSQMTAGSMRRSARRMKAWCRFRGRRVALASHRSVGV